jgi:hypothetical protein
MCHQEGHWIIFYHLSLIVYLQKHKSSHQCIYKGKY